MASAVPSAIPPAVSAAIYLTKPSSALTIDVTDLKDFGISGDEQLTLHSVRNSDALVFDLSEDKTIVSRVIFHPTGTIELALKHGRVLPLSRMQKPNQKTTTSFTIFSINSTIKHFLKPVIILISPVTTMCLEHTESAGSEFQRAEMCKGNITGDTAGWSAFEFQPRLSDSIRV